MAWPMLFHSIRSRLLGLVLATVIPLVTVIGVGLGSQFRDDQNEAMERALDEAKLLAAQVDDHVSKISTRLADTNANDALLRQVKEELPDYVSNILLFAPDGSNIGVSWTGDERINAGGRAYFQEVLAGQRLAIGDVIHTKLSQQWVVTVASPVKDQSGRLRAVLAVGTHLARFQNALRIQHLPAGSIVRIVNHSGIVVASSDNPSLWIGRDLKSAQDVAQAEATKARPKVQVFRLGGDEFVLVVPECGDPRLIGEIVDAVLNRLAQNFEINEHSVRVGGSAGIAIAPNDGTTVDEPLANSDLALYQAKSHGGRTRRFFLPVHRAQVQAHRAVDLELTRAYAERELEI
jgi:hypothetical protein